MAKEGRKISHITAMHFVKLSLRLIVAAAVLVVYVVNRVTDTWNKDTILGSDTVDWVFLGVISAMFFIEMILRFAPSKLESGGCQKIFKKNHQPTKETVPQKQSWKKTFAVFASWIILNAIFGALYYFDIIDEGILLIISLAYSVCDMICILFFCPFQVLMMRNKCCTTCRIYNWDFAMMFTPLIFTMYFFTWKHILTWGLVVLSLALLLEWEIIYRIHPERFTENTNKSLACANCKEKLCRQKKHLRKFIQLNLKGINKLIDIKSDAEEAE